MATVYERSFVSHCTIEKSLRVILEADLPLDVFADDQLRQVYEWVLNYWHSSSAQMPPSPEAMRVHFDNLLKEHEIEPEFDPAETVEWAIEMLKGAYIDRKWQSWSKDFVTDLSMADLGRKLEVLDSYLTELMALSTAVARKSEIVDVRHAIGSRLDAYHQRAADLQSETTVGVTLGLREVDHHLRMVRPGELCGLAGPPKMGKSYELDWAALQHWLNGGTSVLYTLENSVEETLDRIAVMALRLGNEGWSRGTANVEEIAQVERWIEENAQRPNGFWVIQPEPGKRTVEYMVRLAKSLGDAIFIDQLSFVEVPESAQRRPRDQQVREILHELKALISSGQRIPCIIAVQINREGVKAAQKTGYLEMYHLAESSEIERTCDFVLGLWQSEGLRQAGTAYLQMLAARRVPLINWELIWAPWSGTVAVRSQIDLRGS